MGQEDLRHSMVKIRPYKIKDYDLVRQMWESQKLVAPPPGVLGQYGLIT